MEKQNKTAYIKLPGSKKTKPIGTDTKSLDPEQDMEVTVRIRRKVSIEHQLNKGKQYSREEYANMFGASDEDIDKVEAFAHEHHLSVSEVDKGRRSVMLTGSVADFEVAFQVKLACYKNSDGHTFRGRSGEISIPAELGGLVDGVFGLDDRPHVRPMFQIGGKKGKNKGKPGKPKL